jgi:hypothetical protein
MTNYYPEKPSVPYVRTQIEMAKVIAAIQSVPAPAEVKRMAYIMFRNESGNGSSGINNNYCGFQADSARWPQQFDNLISGVVTKVENGTGRTRLFLAFNDISGCIAMLVDRVQIRGLYIGGATHKVLVMAIGTSQDLARAYKKEWVSGSATAEPSAQELNNFLSMYGQAERLFV